MPVALKPVLTSDAYLDDEIEADVRHEFIDGDLYAMAGAGEAHNLITLNVAAQLRTLVRGGPCRVFVSDMKLRVAAWNAFYYPDVMVVCNPADRQTYYKESPCLVIEVLSKSTHRIDRREKLQAYRTLPSLREYVLIASGRAQIEVHRRAQDGIWQTSTLGTGDRLILECVQASLTMDDIYEDVVFAPPAPFDGY